MTKLRKLFKHAPDSSENIYQGLLGLYIAAILVSKIAWIPSIAAYVVFIRVCMERVVLWGSALFLFDYLLKWQKNISGINGNSEELCRDGRTEGNEGIKDGIISAVLGICLLAVTLAFNTIMTPNTYTLVMDIYFCIMAYKKNYRQILRLVLTLSSATLLIGVVGFVIGFTDDVFIFKPDRMGAVHSYGIIHPNIWAEIFFMALMLFWYLYLEKRHILTIILFWIFAFCVNTFLACKTITILLLLFPVMSFIIFWFCKRETVYKSVDEEGLFLSITEDVNKKIDDECGDSNKSVRRKPGIRKIMLVNTPLLFFIITLVLCWQMDWIHDTFYSTRFLSFAMRFVEGGYVIREKGISLFGQSLVSFKSPETSYLQDITHVVDNAFVRYLITRGLLWMVLCLLWFTLTNAKCLKNRDYRLLLISIFMLLLAMMSRCALDMWFNYALLYPFASVGNEMENGSSSITKRKNTA